MECIVHYTNQISYNKIKKLSDTNLEKINQAKLKRLEPGGAIVHKEQVDNIPDVINPDIHGVHLDPCYNGRKFLFTSIH